MKKILVLVGLLLVLGPRAHAQEALFVESTDPVDGAAGIPHGPDMKEVRFVLNKPTPALGSVFASKFRWSPTSSTQLSSFGHGPPPENDLAVVFFTITHSPNTDFVFFVYGVESDDGSRMERPFTLNYTTSETHGSNVVTGAVSFGDRFPAKRSAGRVQLQQGIGQVLAAQRGLWAGIDAQGIAGKQEARVDLREARSLALTPGVMDLNKTVVLLLKRYVWLGPGLDDVETIWRAQAGAASEGPDGAFTFNHVREGVYWPVAFNWVDDEGLVVGSFGIYDPDGDFAPDSVVVGPGGLDGMDLTLYEVEESNAGPLATVARAQVAEIAADQRLLAILARNDAGAGTSLVWQYRFYSPSLDRLTYVDIDFVNVVVERTPLADNGFPQEVTDYMRQQQPIPETMIDSETAFQIAEQNGGADYRLQFDPSAEVPVQMDAGDLQLGFRPPRGEVFWRVLYQPPVAGFDELEIFIDIETGEVLEPIIIANEPEPGVPEAFTLLPNYPNPFNPETTISFDAARRARVTLRVLDVLGRTVRILVDDEVGPGRHQVTWDGTAENGLGVASGVYLYRLEAEGFVSNRVMTFLK